MLKKLLTVALVATIAAATAGAAQAQTMQIRIATEGAYPPFNMKNAAGDLVGFDIDIANALCAEMKAECTMVAQDWDGIIPGLVANKYDAIIASMSITPERQQSVGFTEPYYSNYLHVMAKKGSGLSGADDLSGKSVGAERSTVASQWAEDNLGRTADVKLYDTQTAAYSDLDAGRIDAMVSDIYPAYDWLQSHDGFEFIGDNIDIDDKIGIAIRKNDTELRDAFNAALKTIRDNGTYAEINAKYFPFDIY
ncbi:ABC transporter substrate-binding protein [Devosia algicola]|uniref:ABC transporter substrate-binding protein n=1 Tax=Devosia algicola TaxID=3026418 RepID=A0ABY7YKL5_9HYPH|nr:ABC transporter substrate-binding protein [Devosia algicola]WDR01614.1 ABC transporter substrate-binding protein [Devosia algicola]